MHCLINHQSDIDKIHLYPKDPCKAKYQILINKRKNEGLKHYNDSKAYFKYCNDMQDFHKNIDEYNPGKERLLICTKKLHPIVTELFIGDRKLNVTLFLLRNHILKM